MSEEDEKILNNLVNKKKQVLEFKEVQSIVRLLLDVNKKINRKVKGGKLEKMSEEDEKILNNLVNKKKQVLEFKEVQSIVRLLLDVNKKINRKCKLSLL